jgi:hypothetical protein
MIIRLQKHNGFFPARRRSGISAFAAVFAFVVSRPDLAHLNAVYLFNGVSYLRLIGPFVYLKGVRTFYIRKVHPLLRNQRPNYYIKIIKHSALILAPFVSIQQGQKRLFRKQYFAAAANVASV